MPNASLNGVNVLERIFQIKIDDNDSLAGTKDPNIIYVSPFCLNCNYIYTSEMFKASKKLF
jgi:hypothetical protein